MDAYHNGQIIASDHFKIRIEEPLSQGEMAYAYRATDLNTGSTVLLKSYLTLVPDLTSCPTFNKYVAHQEEIRKRLSAIPDQVIQVLAHFNHNGFYHQVVEWANGKSLDKLMEESFNHSTSLDNHLLLAKLMMFATRKIHEQGIIHCDQKPANFFAEERPELKIGYKVKMADFDMSLIDGRPSPNPEGRALAGTFGYFSPEHYRGVPPGKASDVFTVGGVMLYELLGGVHPFQRELDEVTSFEQANAVIRKVIEKRRIQRFEEAAPEQAAKLPPKLIETIHLAMDPDPARRPTAADIHQLLLNNKAPRTLVLKGGPTGLKWRIKAATVLSRGMCERFYGTELGAVSTEQGRFEPSADLTEWSYFPRAGTTNASMVNGKRVDGPVTLEAGMRLQVGNPTSGKIGLEMEVSFE